HASARLRAPAERLAGDDSFGQRGERSPAASGLFLLVFRLFFGANGGFGGLKADTAMRAVAEGFVDGAATTAEGGIGLACQIVRMTIRIHQLNGTFGGFHAEGTVFSSDDFDLRHASLQLKF